MTVCKHGFHNGFIAYMLRQCFTTLQKVVIWKLLRSVILLKNSQFLEFWRKNFRKDVFYYSVNNFIAFRSLRGSSIPESTNLSVFEQKNKKQDFLSLKGLILLLNSSIFEISFEEHFLMNYSFRNLTWKVKNKMYTKLLLTSSKPVIMA